LQSELTKHQIFLERHAESILRSDVLPILKKMRTDLSNRILNASPFQIARIQVLLKEIDSIIDTAITKIQPSLFESFQALGEYETQYATKLLDSSTVASVTIGAGLEPAVITAMLAKSKMYLGDDKGQTVDDLIATFAKAVKKDIKSVITTGLTAGDTTDVIAKNMIALNSTRTIDQARAVVLTVANHIGDKTRVATWEPYQELFNGMKYVATLDSRTTILCASRDGKIYPFKEAMALSRHYRCRSVLVPAIKEEYALIKDGTRASMGGQVSAKLNYGQWLKTQPKSVIDEVLGVERSKLFRDGKLTLDRFVDKRGATYTLQELKAKDLLK